MVDKTQVMRREWQKHLTKVINVELDIFPVNVLCMMNVDSTSVNFSLLVVLLFRSQNA